MTAAATGTAISLALEGVMRADKGRLLAALAHRLGDISLAEEMLQEACLSALSHWGRSGLPASPQGWLLKVALRRAIDRLRASARAGRHAAQIALLAQDEATDHSAPDIPDERLRLMFACCHPALEPKTRVALTLRVICGLSTAQIAAVFLDNEVAMGQRLSRAKAKIKMAGIGFAIPDRAAWPVRLQSVLTAVYLTYTRGYAAGPMTGRDLCDEAIFLAQLLRALAPQDAEIMGALALMLITQARARAREQGEMLAGQDRALWDLAMLEEGRSLLDSALRQGQAGPFQIKAAVAACHVAQGGPDWPQIGALLTALLQHEDTPVVRLSLAVAVAQVQGPLQGLAILQPLAPQLAQYGPFHAARADMLARSGDARAAKKAYDAAITLAETFSNAAFLRAARENLPRA